MKTIEYALQVANTLPPESAQSILNSILDVYPDQADALRLISKININNASTLMEKGEIEKAEALFLKATGKTNDIDIQAHYSLVQLRKVTSQHASLQPLLKAAGNIESISPHIRELVYFALGKCFDDMGDPNQAFPYFSKGCALKRQRINYNSAEQDEYTKKLILYFTEEKIEYFRQFSNPSSKPIFIIGMPRSGTTLVEQILASHPIVETSGELEYFQTSNLLQFPQTIAKNYLQQLPTITEYIIDKMPLNFSALGLIYALLPNAKIIHVQRDPIDTCLSCYTKLFTTGHYYSYDLVELGKFYNNYLRIMNHWRTLLPPNSWLDINYEDLVQNLEPETKRLIAYCNLDWNPTCLDFHLTNRQVKTASFLQVKQPIYKTSLHRWKQYEKHLTPLVMSIEV